MDAESCYRAVESRDSRIAGRFYVAVKTTGVYCRPGCPARTPRRANVDFFPSAAAAQGAGFRACLRCRPDAAPGTPAWSGTEATISRALRLLEEMDDASTLADRLGLGERQLRRLFARHLGAAPAAILRTRRLHLARQLIESSPLAMIDVAHGAGFRSLRRFNEAVREGFGKTPTELRKPQPPARLPRGLTRGAQSLGLSREPSLDAAVLRLPFRPPLDFSGMLAFLAPRCIPGIESVDGGVYRRTVREGVVEIRLDGERHLALRIPLELAGRALPTVARAQRLFDLRADPEPIARHLARDPLLAPFLLRPGLRVPGAWEPFEMAVRAILGQQISVARARVLAEAIAREHGTALQHGRLFPAADVLARVDLRGMPGARARAVRGLAEAVASGAIKLDGAATLEKTAAGLTALPGIGPWTAQVIALRALGEPDAFPASDLGLCKTTGLTPVELEARSERWRPWRGYAAAAIWMG